MKFIKNSIVALNVSVACLIVILSSVFIYIDKPGPLTTQKTIVIPKKSSINKITNILYQNNIINYPQVFRIIAKVIALKYDLRAGEYRFTPSISIKSIFDIIIKGKSVIHKLTIIEGLTVRQITNIINKEEFLAGEINSEIQEGSLFPDTYFYSYGDTRQTIINRMQIKMQGFLEKIWEKRVADLPITNILEAVTLASIVEKETSKSDERARVAAVFINRLKKKMKLQADPTTIYAITLGNSDLGRTLNKTDLAIKSSFNTYFITGLPPHPICNPGAATIKAVLNPARTNDLFFVVDGTGGHKFSEDYSQHQKNVNEYRKNFLGR